MEQDELPEGESRIEVAYQDSVKLSDNLSVLFACVSLRGFYPDDADKENQDSHVEIPLFHRAAPGEGETEGSLQSFFCLLYQINIGSLWIHGQGFGEVADGARELAYH